MTTKAVQSTQTTHRSLQGDTTQNGASAKPLNIRPGITTGNQTPPTYSLTTAANPTDARTQFQMGKFLQANGDHQTAFNWFLKAANQNDPDAQIAVGYCYENGKGVKKSDDQAFVWFTRAAALNTARGCFALGDFLERHKQKDAAIAQYIKACELGSVDAKEALERFGK